jgi:hypothetical protein
MHHLRCVTSARHRQLNSRPLPQLTLLFAPASLNCLAAASASSCVQVHILHTWSAHDCLLGTTQMPPVVCNSQYDTSESNLTHSNLTDHTKILLAAWSQGLCVCHGFCVISYYQRNFDKSYVQHPLLHILLHPSCLMLPLLQYHTLAYTHISTPTSSHMSRHHTLTRVPSSLNQECGSDNSSPRSSQARIYRVTTNK